MQGSALLVISDVDIHASLKQIVNTERLVLLSSYVHHCRPVLVFDVDISSRLFYE